MDHSLLVVEYPLEHDSCRRGHPSSHTDQSCAVERAGDGEVRDKQLHDSPATSGKEVVQ